MSVPDDAERRMKNARYWADRARDLLDREVTGCRDQCRVEVLAGRAVLVFVDQFPNGGVEAIEVCMQTANFPEYERRECRDGETRLFVEPIRPRR